VEAVVNWNRLYDISMAGWRGATLLLWLVILSTAFGVILASSTTEIFAWW